MRKSKEEITEQVKEELCFVKGEIENKEELLNAIVEKRLKKEIKDAVQTFNYQINSMSTTNG